MENIKIKPLTKEQIIISIDRLTRFKHPKNKYTRVFYDIITHNLIYPQFKKSDLDKINPVILTNYAQEIFNYSLEKLTNKKHIENHTINQKIEEYEKTVFICDFETESLLKNKINYAACLDFIDQNSPQNLLWLKNLKDNFDIISERERQSLHFPVETVVLVEGATEETLLPKFGQMCNLDFDKEGIHIISAGGKNPLVKLYYELIEVLKLPIFILLDKDGEQNALEIKQKLRPTDKIHIIECGEFEDLLPIDLIKKTLNYELKNISIIEKDLLEVNGPHAKLLEEIFKNRGMHEFKKAEFAKDVKINLETPSDISEEIRQIIQEISKVKQIKKSC